MSVPYSRAQHGPLHWPMPFVGVWLRDPTNPDQERYWRLQDAELHETSNVRVRPVDAFEAFDDSTSRQCMWLDVAEPTGQQRLFAIENDGRMVGLDHYRSKP